MLIDLKGKTCHLVDFAVPTDNRMKIELNEKVYKYLDFAWELKKVEPEGISDTNSR